MTAFRSVWFMFAQARESPLSVVQTLDCWASYLRSKISCHLTSLWGFFFIMFNVQLEFCGL